MRVLGVDPGLTRCGVGVVDVAPDRTVTLVAVEVIRTSPDTPLEQRLLGIGQRLEELIAEHRPTAVALEQVFAQLNLRTVMGVAQASGIVLHHAAAAGLGVGLHTPTEVKAALTGYGGADKKQLGTMVARVLRLDQVPRPADASDALALAICHGWKSTGRSPRAGGASETPAQKAWREAERSAAARRLSP